MIYVKNRLFRMDFDNKLHMQRKLAAKTVVAIKIKVENSIIIYIITNYV